MNYEYVEYYCNPSQFIDSEGEQLTNEENEELEWDKFYSDLFDREYEESLSENERKTE